MQWNRQRKLALALLLFVVIASTIWLLYPAPSNEEFPYSPPLICTRLEAVRIIDREPAVVPVYKYAWRQNQTLLVHFNFGSLELKRRVITIANEWSKHCGMTFKDTTNMYLAQIRVTFKGKDYASAVGRESLHASYAGKPTMYLGGLDTMQDFQNFRRIVLHEFGHALGLEHELKNPNVKIPWDTPAVYKYYQDHYHWDETKVRKNILAPLTPEQGKPYDEFDSTSIMIYAIPDTLTRGRMRVEWKYDLSPTDKSGIGRWYPKNQNPI